MGTGSHLDVGRTGELLAAEHLERCGYELVERNFRTREGEIDLIASGCGAIVFCEVKTLVARHGGRALFDPLDSIGPAKRIQLRRLAASWLADHPPMPRQPQLRFDAIGVLLTDAGELCKLDHVENAF